MALVMASLTSYRTILSNRQNFQSFSVRRRNERDVNDV
jgi:hypothetical protein